MGLSSALNVSMNGLSLTESEIGVLGNNIANAGTNGFKASNVEFATQLANTLSFGSAPSNTNGGTNPVQTGLGATVASIKVDFSQGSITATSSPSDLAIQGDGFFILGVAQGSGSTQGASTAAQAYDPLYTRNGSFRLDSGYHLSNNQGLPVLGYPVQDFVVQTQLAPQAISIPLGTEKIAQATTKVVLGGALPPGGTVATQGTVETSATLFDAGNVVAGVAQNITANTLLTNVIATSNPASTPLFNATDTISFAPTKGGRVVEARTLATGANKVSDLENLMTGALGLQPVPPDNAGVTVAGGQITVTGNYGTVNDFDIPLGAISRIPAGSTTGLGVNIPFSANAQRANGSSTVTSFTVYDASGTAQTVRMSAVLESQTVNATTYRYFLESAGQGTPTGSAFPTTTIGNGTITYDNQGRLISGSPTPTFTLSPASTGPINFVADMSQVSGLSSAAGSSLSLVSQDGTTAGTLTSFVIDEQGRVNGSFDNGIIRTLGQVALARFANPDGLLQIGHDSFKEGVASGVAQTHVAGTFGTGSIKSGALEGSNTDISKNLVDLITASTTYQGNARVISSIDQLVTTLLQLGR